MRKTLSVLLIALTAVLLVVSCSQGPESETGLVSFNLGKAKSVTSTSTDIDVSSLKWYISAHRNDDGFWKEGATSDSCDLLSISGAGWLEAFNTSADSYVFTQSLDFDSSMTFSAGSWFMSIQGRTTAGELVYQSPAKTVVVEANKEKPVSFEVENMVGKGKVVLKNITFTFPNANYSGSNLTLSTTVTDLRGDSVFATNTNASVSGDTVTFYSTELEKELGNGLYTFTFLISVGPDDVATSNISVMVYNGYTVTIEGDLNSLSESGTVVVKQNVAVYDVSDGVKYVTADNLQDAFTNVKNGGTITLLATVAPTQTITLDSGNSFTLDLGYYSINSTATPAFAITNNTFVTVLGGIDSKITSNGVVVDINGCGITLQSGSIETTSDTAPAIDCKEGTVEINGGSVEAKKVAIAVSGGNSEVKLNGGSIKAASDGKAIEAKTNAAGTPKVSVAGTKVEAGETDLSEANVTITDSNPSTVETIAEAKIGGTYYATLKDAIGAVVNNTATTITIVKDVVRAEGISVPNGRNITVDFGGHTYVCALKPAGSTNTKNQVFQLLKGSKITFKNGTLKVADNPEDTFKFIIQNYADLTLENITIDGSNCKNEESVSVSSNNGKVMIVGNTSIKSSSVTENALDVSWWPNDGYYADGTQVVIDTTGTIEGKIVLGVWGAGPSKSSLTIKKGTLKGEIVKEVDTGLSAAIADSMCSVEGGAFTDLASVIPYVADGATIKLAADVANAHGISVPSGKNFTVDFAGHTYSVEKPGAGSTNTQTQAFQLIAGSTVVLENGTICSTTTNRDSIGTADANGKKPIKRMIQNYANLTLRNMVIEGENLQGNNSVIELANGTVLIEGSTSISAKEGVPAITVDTWKGAYPDGAHVTINTDGEIGTIKCYSETQEPGNMNKPSSLTIVNGTFDSVTTDGSGNYVITVNGGAFTDLASVIPYVADGKTIKLADNIKVDSSISVTGKISIDLNGKKISSDSCEVFIVGSEGDLTLGNGTIAGPNEEIAASFDGKSVICVEGGKLTLLDCTITTGGKNDCGMYGVYPYNGGEVIFGSDDKFPTITSWFAPIGMNNTTSPAKVTVNGGTYTQLAQPAQDSWWEYFCGAIYAACDAEITINGGTFTGTRYGLISRYKNVDQTITINGGVFNGTQKDIFMGEVETTSGTGTRTLVDNRTK